MKKKAKKHKEAHTQNTKYGMGDHYGTGERAAIGRLRSDTVGFRQPTKKQLGTPPKSLA